MTGKGIFIIERPIVDTSTGRMPGSFLLILTYVIRTPPLVKPNSQKTFQVNLPIHSCVTVRNTKFKMSTWWPSWILAGTGFQKEAPLVDLNPHKKFR
jgi:hypothetical protein